MKNTALITGASAGLGKEFARIHASRKGDLIIIARREETLNALKEELESKYGVTVKVIVKDLSHQTAAKEIYDAVKAEGIQVDYLINNAGFGGQGNFHERGFEADMAMVNVNIVALTALTKLYLPDFVARNSGKILNVSSVASLTPGPLQAVYFATKAYVTSFTNAVYCEVADTNVTVTNLMPGATITEFAQTSGLDKSRLFYKAATAESVARKGYRAMLDGRMDVVAGLNPVMRLILKLMPLFPKRSVMAVVKKGQTVE